MKIDRTHRSWLGFSVGTLVGAAAVYSYDQVYGAGALRGPSGGSAIGLVLGVLGTSFLLFAALLGLRKKFRAWRIGSAQFWMRGHLWLGTLSLPMLWLHGGFRHGGPLTATLMWLLYAVVITGLIGAILQHFLPREITRMVAHESTYEQIPQVIEHLRADADLAASICGPANGQNVEEWRHEREQVLASRAERALITRERRQRIEAERKVAPISGSQYLGQFYRQQIVPYLHDQAPASGISLAHPEGAAALFSEHRLHAPKALHPALNDLERICVEYRQLRIQQRMHRWLHTWMLVHVPLSMALLVLAAFHVIVALRFSL
jgi:hypothetical protein